MQLSNGACKKLCLALNRFPSFLAFKAHCRKPLELAAVCASLESKSRNASLCILNAIEKEILTRGAVVVTRSTSALHRRLPLILSCFSWHPRAEGETGEE